MSTDPQLGCVCSTVGYADPAWLDHYYPETCPPDWRLAYFMNDFRAVYLRPRDWCAEPAQLEHIVDELEGGFELVLEWPAEGDVCSNERLVERLLPVASSIACIVVRQAEPADDRRFALLTALRGRWPVNLINEGELDQGTRAFARQHDIGEVWQPGLAVSAVPMGAYQVVLLPCLGLRQIKSLLLELQPAIDRGVRAGLFIEPGVRSAQRALDTRTLIELLALA